MEVLPSSEDQAKPEEPNAGVDSEEPNPPEKNDPQWDVAELPTDVLYEGEIELSEVESPEVVKEQSPSEEPSTLEVTFAAAGLCSAGEQGIPSGELVLPVISPPSSETCLPSSSVPPLIIPSPEPEINNLSDLILQNSRILLGALTPAPKEPTLTSQRVFFFDLKSDKYAFSKVEIEVPNNPQNHQVWLQLNNQAAWLIATEVKSEDPHLRRGLYHNSESQLVLSGPTRFTLRNQDREELFMESRVLLSVIPKDSSNTPGWCVLL